VKIYSLSAENDHWVWKSWLPREPTDRIWCLCNFCSLESCI